MTSIVVTGPTRGTHAPEGLTPEARDQLAGLLAALADHPKDAFKVCGPAGPVQDLLSRIGAGGRTKSRWRQNLRP